MSKTGTGKFTEKEKKSFLLKKHIKNHMFEYIVETIINVAFADLIVYISGGSEYLLVSLLAVVYSIFKILYNLKSFKKDFIDIKVNGDNR